MWPGGIEIGDGAIPVCMDAKVPVALKATLSQRPETVQQARMGRSVYGTATSSRSRESQLRWVGRLLDGTSSWEDMTVILSWQAANLPC